MFGLMCGLCLTGIVRHIAKLQICDEIWVLPVYKHMYASKALAVDYEHRLRMAELNFKFAADLTEHGQLERLTPVVVLDLEKTLHEQEADPWLQTTETKTLGTIDLVLALNVRYPKTHFSFLLGSDAFDDLLMGKWKESEKLLELLEFHVASRVGYTIERKHKIPPPPKCSIHVIPGLTDISSSYVRNHTTRQRSQQEVHPAVYNYIQEHNLFGLSKAGQTKTLLWTAFSVLCTVGALAYRLWDYRTAPPIVGSQAATALVDGRDTNTRASINKVGGWVKKLLDQDKPVASN